MSGVSFQRLGYSRSLNLDNISIESSQVFNDSNNPPSSKFLKKHSGKISFVALISIGLIALAIKNRRNQTSPPKKYHVTGKIKTTVLFD